MIRSMLGTVKTFVRPGFGTTVRLFARGPSERVHGSPAQGVNQRRQPNITGERCADSAAELGARLNHFGEQIIQRSA